MKKTFYTKKELAKFLDCSISKIDHLIKNKEIEYFKYGTSKQSSIKFSETHITNFLKSSLR